MDYGILMTSSWGLTWRNKGIILLGIVTSLPFFASRAIPFAQNSELSEFLPYHAQWVVFVYVIFYLFIVPIGLWGKSGIIYLAKQVSTKDHENTPSTSGSAISIAAQSLLTTRKDFLRLFSVTIIAILGALLLSMGFGVFGLMLSIGSDILFFLCMSITVLSTSLVAMLIWNQSVVALVTAGLEPLAAIQRGWQVVKKNLGQHLVVAILLGLIFGGIILPFGGSAYLVDSLVTGQTQTIFRLLAFPILVIIYGVFIGFVNTVWTRLFLQLAQTD